MRPRGGQRTRRSGPSSPSDLELRGQGDGVGDLYSAMLERGELRTWPGRVERRRAGSWNGRVSSSMARTSRSRSPIGTGKRDGLMVELRNSEGQLQAAIEAEATETRGASDLELATDAEGAEYRGLVERARLSSYVLEGPESGGTAGRVGSPSPILGDPTASFPELGAGFDGFGGPPSVKGVSCPSNGPEPSGGGVLGPPGRASSFPPGKAPAGGGFPDRGESFTGPPATAAPHPPERA